VLDAEKVTFQVVGERISIMNPSSTLYPRGYTPPGFTLQRKQPRSWSDDIGGGGDVAVVSGKTLGDASWCLGESSQIGTAKYTTVFELLFLVAENTDAKRGVSEELEHGLATTNGLTGSLDGRPDIRLPAI
jgi:hypothetical protein